MSIFAWDRGGSWVDERRFCLHASIWRGVLIGDRLCHFLRMRWDLETAGTETEALDGKGGISMIFIPTGDFFFCLFVCFLSSRRPE